jgi:hypothetical protein
MVSTDEVLEAYNRTGSARGGAKDLGISRTHFRRLLDKAKKHTLEIKGILPATSNVDPEIVISRLIEEQEKKEKSIALSRSQRIKIKTDQPFVLALFSDLHIGNNKTDYRALVNDTKLVSDCPFAYALSAGDHSENWVGKLGWISREQHMSLDTEQRLVSWWFDQIKGSMIAVCAGNHDARSVINAGIDFIRTVLGDAVLLYDLDQILFTLELPDAEIVFKIRHKDQYKSILNPFHGAFRDIERGDCAWDCYISGHDHKATLFGDYLHHDRPKKVVRIGTYKMDDRFGKYLGFAKSYGVGSGALVISPDGAIQSYQSIATAIKCCEAMRA